MSDHRMSGPYYYTGVDLDELAWADKDADRLDIILNALTSICQCAHCQPHASDCAVHNGELIGPCDCRPLAALDKGNTE